MPAIGTDCHITLAHVDIDGGAAYGFLVNVNHRIYPEGVRINREVISSGMIQVWLYFDVLLADDLLNPDGTIHAQTRAQMYSKLLQFLDMPSGIEVATPVGTFSNLGALGFTADERHMPLSSLVKVQLNNAGYYWPPVAPELLAQSVWDGVLTWNTSYWR